MILHVTYPVSFRVELKRFQRYCGWITGFLHFISRFQVEMKINWHFWLKQTLTNYSFVFLSPSNFGVITTVDFLKVLSQRLSNHHQENWITNMRYYQLLHEEEGNILIIGPSDGRHFNWIFPKDYVLGNIYQLKCLPSQGPIIRIFPDIRVVTMILSYHHYS